CGRVERVKGLDQARLGGLARCRYHRLTHHPHSGRSPADQEGRTCGKFPRRSVPVNHCRARRRYRWAVDQAEARLTQPHCGAARIPGEAEADRYWLNQAIDLSRKCPVSEFAFSVGAILVSVTGEVLATGYSRETDPKDHAEEVALRRASGTDLA